MSQRPKRISMGCYRQPENLVGQKFYRLTVISFAGKAARNSVWNCACDCGRDARVIGSRLKSGKTKSCGCQRGISNAAKNMKHGHAARGRFTPEYKAWRAMLDRCYNPKNKRFSRYGARGIVVCDRWRGAFERFLADVGKKPTQKHSLDRHPNNDGNYEPGNVRWALPTEQANNTSRNRRLTADGRTMTLSQWALDLGISYPMVHGRLRNGWTVDQALGFEVRP